MVSLLSVKRLIEQAADDLLVLLEDEQDVDRRDALYLAHDFLQLALNQTEQAELI